METVVETAGEAAERYAGWLWDAVGAAWLVGLLVVVVYFCVKATKYLFRGY